MKKVLFAVCFLGVAVTVNAGTTPLLVEAYQEGTINIPAGEWDTVTIVEVTFSVDTSCYVQFATGGISTLAKVWLRLNEEKLPPLLIAPGTYDFINITYSYFLTPDEYTITFELASGVSQDFSAICEQAYLQALIFLPDAGGAIAERPDGDVDADALGEMTSVISRGPYVTVTGATELVDGTGRVIENAIDNDRVSINNLSQGTYFARKEGKTVVKIVKVD